MAVFSQRSFAGGEIAPALYARVDTVKYMTGLKKCKNFFLMRHGGVANRPGTQFVYEVPGSVSNNARLVPFVYDEANTYVLLFAVGNIYPFQDAAYVGASVAHTYSSAEISELQFVQSGNVMTIVHPSHPPRELTLTAPDTFVLDDISFVPDIQPPTSPALIVGTVGGGPAAWVITSIASETFEESFASAAVTSGAWPTDVAPVTISWTPPVGFSVQAYNIYRDSGGGSYGFVGTSGGTSFTDRGYDPDLSDLPPTPRNPFGSSGNYPAVVTYAQQRRMFANSTNDPDKVWMSRIGAFTNFTTSSPIQDDDAITFSIAGRQVNVVRHLLDLGRLVAFTSSGEWVINEEDQALTPLSLTPKQRSYNGASTLSPIVIGRSALYVQARGAVVRDFEFEQGDSLSNDLTIFAAHLFDGYTLLDWTYQQIPHQIVWAVRDDGTLLGLTYVKEHELVGWHRHDLGGTVENVCSVPEGTEDALYVIVTRVVNGVTRRYLERLNTRKIVDIVDAVFMDSALTYDGRNYGSTTMKLSGKAITGATQANPCVITSNSHGFANGDQVSIYGVGGMTQLNGNTYTVAGVTANTFQLSGINSTGYSAYTSGGSASGWTYTETLTLTASASFFVAGDVGNQIHLTSTDGTTLRFTIDAYTSGTVVTGRPNRTVPVDLRGATTVSWAKAVDVVTGLGHLEAEDVSVFADGFVVANPNNAAYTVRTVTGGELELDKPYAVIHVGLPIVADLETLDLDSPQGDTLAGEMKNVGSVGVHVESSRGMFVGPAEPDGDDAIEGLYEPKLPVAANYDDPTELRTGIIKVPIRTEWNSNGRIFVRQVDPLPLSVLAVSPFGMFGGKK